MKKIILIFTFLIIFASSGYTNDILPGGATERKPVLSLNFMGGTYDAGLELEIDFNLNESMSLAPRLGLSHMEWFAPGVSLRFGIIKGKRPHGFWVGPSMDFIVSDRGSNNSTRIILTPAAEFGWRYTFDFGLSITPMARLGFYVGDGDGAFWSTGLGLGYAF